ncbi:MAG: hypothetical protein HYX20_00800 [Candidatus Yanofskybacteria bacterium]|nr:hypothetical protein [Candidatus Yanofskybacteria bacterium]
MKSEKFIESIERLVELNELDTCALALGFNQNQSATEQLKDVAGAEKLKLFEDILLDVTKRMAIKMKFKPSEEMKIIYSQIAETELKRLADMGETSFRCKRGHSLEKHRKSLESVLLKLKPTVN